MLQRIWSVLQKEFIQDLRDWRTLTIMLFTPLLQLVLFGYAISMNVKHIPTVVADQSRDSASRQYLDAISSSGYFNFVAFAPDEKALQDVINAGQARAGIFIPPNFAYETTRGQAQVAFLVDGSDLFTSQSAYNAASSIAQAHAASLLLESLDQKGIRTTSDPLTAHLRVLYNPDMKDVWFIVPGMIAVLLQYQTILLTTSAIVRERESGTIEQILVTPIRPIELMLGKLAPNILMALINMFTILGIGVIWFGVPFRGNFFLFLILALIYMSAGLGLGLVISTVSENQRQAQQLTMMFGLVGMLLGGFIFPRYTMPQVIQWVGAIFPLTYFVPISRGIISKGIGLEFILSQVLTLVVYVLIMMVFAARAFRQRLD